MLDYVIDKIKKFKKTRDDSVEGGEAKIAVRAIVVAGCKDGKVDDVDLDKT